MSNNISLDDLKAQQADLLAMLMSCDDPFSERARELRAMLRGLERGAKTPDKKMNPLEQRRAEEMAARLHLPATEDEEKP